MAGWTYRAHLPLIGGGGQVGSVAGAQRWLVSPPDGGFTSSSTGFALRDARCVSSHQPTGSTANPSLSQQGISFSWYDCVGFPVQGKAMHWCVGAGDLGVTGGVEYTAAPGSCDHPQLSVALG